MKMPDMTIEQRLALEKIYKEHMNEWGLTLYTYVGDPPQVVVDREEDYYRRVKEVFGEDSEITQFITQKRTGFFTGT